MSQVLANPEGNDPPPENNDPPASEAESSKRISRFAKSLCDVDTLNFSSLGL